MTKTETKLQRKDYILARADAMLKARKVYSDRWPLYENIWKMVQEKRTGQDEWRAVLPDTWAFATIKTAQSAFVSSKVVPTIIRHKDEPTSKAEDQRDLYTDIAEKGNLDQELYFTRLDAFKLGNGFIKTIYCKKQRTVWQIQKYNPKTDEFKWKLKTINEFDDPKTFRVSPYLVLVDDLARFGSLRDLIEIEVMGRDEAEAQYGHLVKDFSKVIPESTNFLGKVKAQPSLQIAETDGTGLRGTEFEGANNYHFFAPGFEWSDDVVEILHYWNQGIMTPSGSLDSYEILINGYPVKIDTKNEPQPIPYIHKQIPFDTIPYSPYSMDEYYAAGIIEIGISEATAIKKHREMMDDRQKISLFSPAFSDVNDEIDQKQLKLAPLAIIRTKGGVPRQFQIPGITTADLSLLDRAEMAYKRATGIDERILGLQSSGPQLTATEVSFLREAAMKRLQEFSFLYKNVLLHGEIKKKFSLFKQYFSSPLSRERLLKNDAGVKVLRNKFKEFKVTTGNTYTMKEVSPNYFEGETNVDLDLQVLMPMTQAEMVTMWSQILRDSVPFVQGGLIDIDLAKVFSNYVESLGSHIDDLRSDTKRQGIKMAEAEHQAFADDNTSEKMETILPNGTQAPFLTEEHLLKHSELSDSDTEMSDQNRLRLNKHILKDIQNLKMLAVENKPKTPMNPQDVMGVGGIRTGGGMELLSPAMQKNDLRQ